MNNKRPKDIIVGVGAHSADGVMPDYTTPNFALVSDSERIKTEAEMNQPYRLCEYRIIRVLSGTALYCINLVEYHLSGDDLLLVPAKSIIEVKEYSDEFAVEVVIMKSLPPASAIKLDSFPQKVVKVALGQSALERVQCYFALMKLLIAASEPSDIALTHVAYALSVDMLRQWEIRNNDHSKVSASSRIIENFIALLNQFGTRERSVSFYSDKLNLTPNYLNAVVKRLTGTTVMAWANRATISEAKVLLGHSSMQIQDMAQRLNFTQATVFVRYFRHHTGETPLTYRRNLHSRRREDSV